MQDIQEYVDEVEARLAQGGGFSLTRALIMAVIGFFVYQILFRQRPNA